MASLMMHNAQINDLKGLFIVIMMLVNVFILAAHFTGLFRKLRSCLPRPTFQQIALLVFCN